MGSFMNDDILEHPYVNAGAEEISLLQTIEREHPKNWIGKDKPVVEVKPEQELHWSEREAMGYKAQPGREWPLGDQMSDHSDDEEYDEPIEEEIL